MGSTEAATIRPPRAEDRTSVIEVAEASGLFPPEELADVATTLDGFLTGAAGNDRWVIDDTGTTTAAVAYYAPERMTDGTWNLFMLAVHPDHQRAGRGAALVRHVEADLVAGGARVLLIETSGVPDFAGQRAFYLGLGYTEEARIRDFYERGDDKVVYWKDLTPDGHHVDGPTPSPPVQPSSAVRVRVADRSDASRLLRLAVDFYREDGFTTAGDEIRRNIDALLVDDKAHVVVVEEGGRSRSRSPPRASDWRAA